MPILARDNRKDYTPAPEGLHQAVCVDVVDLGTVETQWGAKEQVEIRWQIDAENPDNQNKRFMAVKRYTLSLNEKAKLRQHLEAWRGRKFTTEELGGFDLEKLIGVNCQVQIVHNILDDGRKYGNVQTVVGLGRGMAKIQPEDYVRAKDRPKEHGTGKVSTAAHEDDADNGDGEDDIPF